MTTRPAIVRTADATPVLTAYVVVLLAMPAGLRMPALGSAGAPATILALALFVWWLWFHIQRDQSLPGGAQPVRMAMLGWILVITVAYVHAMSTPLPFDERSPADNAMLRALGLAGILLVANDGISSLDHLRRLAGRVVGAVGLVAVLGLFQYATQQLWVDKVTIPGFPRVVAVELALRSGLVRPSGTATHPIEFGVVMTTVLPVAVACARGAVRHRWIYWAVVFAISFAILLSISRSAIICGIVGMLVLLLSWPMITRVRALCFLLLLLTLAFLTVPGLLGTLTNLFTRLGSDSSVSSRTGSYGVAWTFIERDPLLGRGFGTFLPKYRILDNGYLGVLIETGIVGLLSLLTLVVVGFLAARKAMRLSAPGFERELSSALAAAIAAGGAALPFFDTFAFPQAAGVFLLVLGMAGALRRLLLVEEGKALANLSAPPVLKRVARTPRGLLRRSAD